ncbi:MAG: hypothetical protein ACE5JL_18445 [Dehalococcoidia bacterium]
MIYVECKPDFTLLKSITNISKRGIVHEFKGKYEICKQLEKRTHCKGLIDEDPLSFQPAYVKRLRLDNDLPEHDLKVLYDSSKHNYLIVLCPRLEEWVLKVAWEAGIDVRKYDLPDHAVRLHREINIRLDKFERLLQDLKDSDKVKALRPKFNSQNSSPKLSLRPVR